MLDFANEMDNLETAWDLHEGTKQKDKHDEENPKSIPYDGLLKVEEKPQSMEDSFVEEI